MALLVWMALCAAALAADAACPSAAAARLLNCSQHRLLHNYVCFRPFAAAYGKLATASRQ